jgi:succinyl-diaminopimelate desuccinylase
MDMRILPQYPLQAVLGEIDAVKREIERKFGVSITYSAHQKIESKATPTDAVIVKRLSQAVKAVYGVEARAIGIGGGTVAAPLRNLGIECAVWSRLDDCAHQPNEYALVSNILGDAKVMAHLMIGEI